MGRESNKLSIQAHTHTHAQGLFEQNRINAHFLHPQTTPRPSTAPEAVSGGATSSGADVGGCRDHFIGESTSTKEGSLGGEKSRGRGLVRA